jgi:hypothetical protein
MSHTLVGRTFQLDVLLWTRPCYRTVIGPDSVSAAVVDEELMVAGDRSVSDRASDNLLTGLVAIW